MTLRSIFNMSSLLSLSLIVAKLAPSSARLNREEIFNPGRECLL